MTLTLLDLPAEVRQQIWRHVTRGAYVSTVRHLAKPRYNRSIDKCHSLDVDRDDKKRPWAFLLTCKLVWNDAHHLYLTCDTLRSTWLCLVSRPALKHRRDQIRTIQLSDYCRDCSIGLRKVDNSKQNGDLIGLVRDRLLQFSKLEEVCLPTFVDFKTHDPVSYYEVRKLTSFLIADSGPWFLPGLEASCPDVHFIFDIVYYGTADCKIRAVSQTLVTLQSTSD